MEFTRQNRIYDPKEQRAKITIVGVGSTGSFVALTLAKMGIENIKIIDFDNVEPHNLPNQFYRTKDLNKPKVEALKEIIKEFTDVNIEIENIKITEEYEFDLDLNSIVIFCVDNMEARQLIFNKIKDAPINIIDTRFGGEGFSVHPVNLENEEIKDKFEKSLYWETKETSCGEKGIIYTILSLASEVCNIVKKIEKSEKYPTILRRELKTYRFISDIK